MLRMAMVFLVLAIIAGAFGFFAVAGAAVGIAKLLFWLFVVLCVVTFVAGMAAGRKLTS